MQFAKGKLPNFPAQKLLKFDTERQYLRAFFELIKTGKKRFSDIDAMEEILKSSFFLLFWRDADKTGTPRR